MPSSTLTLSKDRIFLWALLVGTLSSGALSIVYSLFFNQTHENFQWQQLLWLIFLSPVLEELLFRGGIQRLLLMAQPLNKNLSGLSFANWITSFLFGALHFFTQSFFWAAAIIIPSLLFGWFRDRYNSVIPSIFLHVLFNAGFFLPLLFF